MVDEEELTPFEQLETEVAREQSEQQAQQQADRIAETDRARLTEVSEQNPDIAKALHDNRLEQGQEGVEPTQADKQDVYAQAAAIGQDMQSSGVSHSEIAQTEQVGFITPSETPDQAPQYATSANNEELAAASQHYGQAAAEKTQQSPMDTLQAEAVQKQAEPQQQQQQQQEQEQ